MRTSYAHPSTPQSEVLTCESRQRGIAAALDTLLKQQNALGLSNVLRATVPFWDRPYLHPDPTIVSRLLEPIQDAEVRALQLGHGSIEQRTDNVDILLSPQARRRMITA